MKVEQEVWTVGDFVSERDNIQIAPAWQRGAAWAPPRQVLLIDSMLRGLDIPKVYLRVRDQPNAFSYDAVDGQQRLRAIWLFREDELPLVHPDRLEKIGDLDVTGCRFSELPKRLRDSFDTFAINVAKIVEADQLEISILFSRLQQGVPLNPAELRNAMLGPVRNAVETIALSHDFLLQSRIPEARYRRQDYVAHIFALAAHGTDRDLKAPNLRHLYQEFSASDTIKIMKISKEVNAALDILERVDKKLGTTIRHKWIVVDLAWWIVQQLRLKFKIDDGNLAQKFAAFDLLRKRYTSAPEDVLEAGDISKKLARHLYDYLIAFKLQAGTKASLATRSEAINQFLRD
jgi:hypothetical protein